MAAGDIVVIASRANALGEECSNLFDSWELGHFVPSKLKIY